MRLAVCRQVGLWSLIGWMAMLTLIIAPDALARDPRSGNQTARVKGPERPWVSPAAPVFERRMHYAGEVWMGISNRGVFGTSHGAVTCLDMELLRINWCPSFEFPGGSQIDYLWDGGFWFGGIKGVDTLVSSTYSQSGGNFEFNSFAPFMTSVPEGHTAGCGRFGEGLQLEQVYTTVYSDTLIDLTNADSHTPMGLEVMQISHQASDNFARNFVIFDLYVKNISDEDIRNFYVGAFTDGDAYYKFIGGTPYEDDISGILKTWPNQVDPKFDDTLLTAWTADNDGDPQDGSFPALAARGAMGIRFLRYPTGARVAYNWWSAPGVGLLDWGPRLASDSRDLGTGGNGIPQGDRNAYHYLSNGEIDYPQLQSGLDFSADGWRPPPGEAVCNLADGADTRSVLSAGPKDVLAPGEVATYTIAFIAAENIHRFPDNEYDCAEPQPYIDNLDMSDLAKNAWWAGFVFDNFGVDTDKNGYAGEYYEPVTGLDTVFYTGDGCPDFTGPEPPRGPSGADLKLISRPQRLEIIWSGRNTELDIDPLVRINDFEGYKIYIAERNSRDDIPASGDYSLLASWDLVDYRRYTYEPRARVWEVSSNPLSIEQWRAVFKDNTCADPTPEFDPRDYPNPSLQNAYCYYELDEFGQTVRKLAYFEPQDFNQSNWIAVGGDSIPNLIQQIEVRDTTIGDAQLQYGVYRVYLDNLLPSKHYFVSVTAFDFGDPENDLDPLETAPGVSRVDGIPIFSSDVVDEFWQAGGAFKDSVRVTVYPNPYKATFRDAQGNRTSYREQGFEGRFGQQLETINDLDRRIHFINLPDTATIRIYTLDGDLVRELEHPHPILSSYTSKISWDLVSRNQQAVESGIYLYRVDSRLGAQIGKLVIIK